MLVLARTHARTHPGNAPCGGLSTTLNSLPEYTCFLITLQSSSSFVLFGEVFFLFSLIVSLIIGRVCLLETYSITPAREFLHIFSRPKPIICGTERRESYHIIPVRWKEADPGTLRAREGHILLAKPKEKKDRLFQRQRKLDLKSSMDFSFGPKVSSGPAARQS